MPMAMADMTAPPPTMASELDRLRLVRQDARQPFLESEEHDAADDGRECQAGVVGERAVPGDLTQLAPFDASQTMATIAPAAGPPRAIAAMMNGRWNVRTPWPWSCSTFVPPSRPMAIQKTSPRRMPSRPPVVVSEMVSSIGKVTHAQTRDARPATITMAV